MLTTKVYGCHSTVAPMNRKHERVVFWKYPVSWPYKFTVDCQYDKKDADIKCLECNQIKKG